MNTGLFLIFKEKSVSCLHNDNKLWSIQTETCFVMLSYTDECHSNKTTLQKITVKSRVYELECDFMLWWK